MGGMNKVLRIAGRMGGVAGRIGPFALLLAMAAPAPAQTLDDVDRFVRDGRMQEAREALMVWMEANPRPNRADRQRVLWWQAALTLDPQQAEPIYRRLVLEYPGGTFTDQALYRLSLAADLRGDLLEAEAGFSTLVRDYLASPLRNDAADWLSRNREALAEAHARVAQATREAGPTRPGGQVRPPRSDVQEAPPPPDTRVRGEPEGAGAGDYTAQVGAFTTAENARALAVRVAEAGFDARVVQTEGSDFFRVRVGRFETIEEAREMITRLQAAGLEAGLGAGAATERIVR
jgi:cell division septation protein DedD